MIHPAHPPWQGGAKAHACQPWTTIPEVHIMKTKRPALLAAGLLVLGGCATTQSPTAEQRSSSHYDERYIGVVNNLAHRSGTRVIWVNPPRTSAQEESGD